LETGRKMDYKEGKGAGTLKVEKGGDNTVLEGE
jgi:hypothetical protein